MGRKKLSKKGRKFNMDITCERPCTPSESVAQAIKEMMLMRQGKIKKRTWEDFEKEMGKDK